MATRSSSSKNAKTKTSRTSRNIKNKSLLITRLSTLGRSRYFVVVVILLFALVGAYIIITGHAAPSDDDVLLPDQPSRGLVYNGKKVKANGPCKGMFDVTSAVGNSNGKSVACGHIDPGPEGTDVRQRDTQVDSDIQKMVDHDKKNPPVASDDQSQDPNDPSSVATTYADVGTPGSLANAPSRNFPCYGTGSDGYRVRFVYVYASGNSNRISSLAAGFNTIARRMNGVMYASSTIPPRSGAAYGGSIIPKQIRFMTNNGSSGCVLNIAVVSIAASSISNYDAITQRLAAVGLKSTAQHYVVEVDGGSPCGQGGAWGDTTPGQTNYNNTTTGYAVIWHPCWDYAEPHELMHTLGSVQPSAPYATPGYHCRDQHDVMCYNDGTASTFVASGCSNSIYIWRYDCNGNTYFNSTTAPSGWISTHWNTAHSRWLR